MRISIVGGLAVYVLAGCVGQGPADVTTTFRDSAGVTIAETSSLSQAELTPWALSPEPLTTIGSYDGPEESQLFRVRGALVLPDGRIAVGNSGTGEIRIFDADGRFLHSLGGEGEGPGEFSYLALVGLTGDSLVAVDRRLRRISLVHPDQGFVRSFYPEEAVAGYLLGTWLFEDGTLLVRDIPLDEGALADGFHRDPEPFRTCDLDGNLLSDLGTLPGPEAVIVTRRTEHGIATLMQSVPFGRGPQVAVGGNRMYFSSQDSFQISAFGSDGRLLRLIRVDRDPIPVTDDHLSAFIEGEIRELDANQARERRRDLETMPRPDVHPAHGRLAADHNGYLYVEDYRLPGESAGEWTVFETNGRPVGSLRFPPDFDVMDIGDDYVLGVQTDELGLESLQLYELQRAG